VPGSYTPRETRIENFILSNAIEELVGSIWNVPFSDATFDRDIVSDLSNAAGTRSDISYCGTAVTSTVRPFGHVFSRSVVYWLADVDNFSRANLSTRCPSMPSAM
jgi:hypothetical protein